MTSQTLLLTSEPLPPNRSPPCSSALSDYLDGLAARAVHEVRQSVALEDAEMFTLNKHYYVSAEAVFRARLKKAYLSPERLSREKEQEVCGVLGCGEWSTSCREVSELPKQACSHSPTSFEMCWALRKADEGLVLRLGSGAGLERPAAAVAARHVICRTRIKPADKLLILKGR